MDSASENEDLSTQFLHQHHVAGDQYILSGGSIDGDTEGKGLSILLQKKCVFCDKICVIVYTNILI